MPWLNVLDVFLRVMGVLVLPLFFWLVNLRLAASHQKLKQAVDEGSALTLSGAARLIRRHNADLSRLKEVADHLNTQVDLLFAKVELLEMELRRWR
ncbi:MAG: hypothetical protein ACYDAG_15350 [Chloroflexota bacterium]